MAALALVLLAGVMPRAVGQGAALAAGDAATICPAPPLCELIEAEWIDRDRRFVADEVAAKALEVTTAEDAAGGCDGFKNGGYGFHVASNEQDPWWQVDLEDVYVLDRVVIYNRTEAASPARTRNVRVLVASEPGGELEVVYEHNGETFYGVKEGEPLTVRFNERDVAARIVRLAIAGTCSFALDEVEVYATDEPETNIALGKPADQISTSPHSYPGTRGAPPSEAGERSFPLAHTRQVVDRAHGLAQRLEPTADRARLGPLAEKLADVRARLSEIEGGRTAADTRKALYLEARWVARAIAFCNPVLDLEQILFIKRHHARGVFHMCDQYYGFNAVPGGGLFVLRAPFSAGPTLVNLIEEAAVEAGRLAGGSLSTGAFLSPELSFDGATILFAYSEAGGEDLEWTPESCYHIFKVNADGSGLAQLTDGPWDDFDPCFLPDGRIAFISERRGGYLRCGRHCPTYAMYSMAPDGSDMTRLSFHETHEWHPSVNHDGLIVYTRWDYVDRDTNVAHHIWTCYPDGRDPRAFHGNYPVRRESRPWMEMSIRAIPGSHRYVATAAAHHGHAFGSLVLIDPRIEDDRAMAQVTRLTPEVPFPEAERHIKPIAACMVYGTPWPLSEDDYLCAYAADARNHGLYWIDRFGNRELLYSDHEIPSMSPIPLRPRTRPPIIPRQSGDGRATLAVMNVYESDFDWPEGTKVSALRIMQALPKTTAPPNQPRIGVAEQSNARAVLGAVPVEADGSAYFEAPAGKLLYFQALDEDGLAIQSMRSGAYLHPGERLTCLGCHERKHGASPRPGLTPSALRRAPSKIQPDVDGSNPFSYVRLVQPVLDRHCVACHQQQQALDLTGVIEGPYGWSRSYQNLAAKYGFYFNVRNGSINHGVHGGTRTIPGRFGARAAPLIEYLDQRHHGLELPLEARHRLTLWLDANCEFYGSYENTKAQSRGDIVYPTLD